MKDAILMAHSVSACTTLGPGRRFVLWVRGCSRRCPGCIATPILDTSGGHWTLIDEVVEKVLAQEDIEGITLSGGEPFEQEEGLAELCRRLRRERDLTFMSYSGFKLEELERRPAGLLAELDILVDGPFVESLGGEFRWRGSSNQRIHFLSPRYTHLAALPDVGAGVEVHVGPAGQVFWAGVPEPGFAQRLSTLLHDEGIALQERDGMWS